MGFHKNITFQIEQSKLLLVLARVKLLLEHHHYRTVIALSKQTITSSFLRKLEKGFQLIYELSHQDAKIFRFFLVNSSFLSTMKDIALI